MSARRRHENRNRTGKTYVVNNSDVPSWAKEESVPEVGISWNQSESTGLLNRNNQISPEDMSKDRTNEFRTICRSIGTNAQHLHGTHPLELQGSQRNRQKSQFTKSCKSIGSDITKTWGQLERLTQLCKSTTLFNDKPIEIQELTYIIKQQMDEMRKRLAELEQIRANTGHQKDREKHDKSVIRSLQSKLATMSTNFKTTLETRRESMNQQRDRRNQFNGAATIQNKNKNQENLNLRQSVLFNDDQRAQKNEASGAVVPTGGFQGQMFEEQDQYLAERSNAMAQVESTIVELGDMFTQLATMVQEQEESIMRIDSNVEESELNIEAAHSELLKYFRSVTSNRWLMVKIFATVIIFFIVFVVFFA
jgi:syntaxin 5